MDNGLEEVKLEEILSKRGDILYDGKPVVPLKEAFQAKEFVFIFYGSSRDPRSRQVGQCLNEFAEHFNPDHQGMRQDRDEYNLTQRTCQIVYIPCEANFMEFQNYYAENYEFGWLYPNFPMDDGDEIDESQLIFCKK